MILNQGLSLFPFFSLLKKATIKRIAPFHFKRPEKLFPKSVFCFPSKHSLSRPRVKTFGHLSTTIGGRKARLPSYEYRYYASLIDLEQHTLQKKRNFPVSYI